MKPQIKTPKTLQEAVVFFADESNCLSYLAARRWPNGKAVCPTCGSKKVRFLATRRIWECKSKHAGRQFSIKVGTIFEDSPIPLGKWLVAIWMLANCKKGVSSYEIHRALGITQKSAWFMLHRIRLAVQTKTFAKLGGEVEADETYIGGKARNMHADKRKKLIRRVALLERWRSWACLRGTAKSAPMCLPMPTSQKSKARCASM
jgi:transposase-like protein